jgi:tetratricopeptide (TPR) repeat protein
MKAAVSLAILIGLLAGIVVYFRGWRTDPAPGGQSAAVRRARAATYVGRAACAECHPTEAQLWQGSHHDLAMQPASAETVLGDFDGATHDYHGTVSTFSKRGDRYFVRTDGPDGKLQDFEIAYTFGVFPLQQYLIAFPGGRYQALNVCWDTRPREAGGQRWFHLYPDEHVAHDDILHWTGPYQNWNHMCAECHSTHVRKGYDAANDTFHTSYSEIDVSCEACHGPGSAHVAWARAAEAAGVNKPHGDPELVVRFKEAQAATWTIDPATGLARRDPPRTSHAEIETCARCHSRRGWFHEDVLPGGPLEETHRPALLEETLFEYDGQIKDEVYEYASFQQSRMYAAGVTCSDCHEPHALRTLVGNATCARCHLTTKFDTPEHHFHKADAPGSACVECHAPTRNYMVVHARHDHSFRVPRPDLTLKLGAPNACNQCHQDRTAAWAAEAALEWWGPRTPGLPHYGEALAAGQQRVPRFENALVGLLSDAKQPTPVRATAAMLLGGSDRATAAAALRTALQDPAPQIRAAAVSALRRDDAATLVRLAAPLLTDPVRLVRIDAARALAGVPEAVLDGRQRAARDDALAEYRAAQLVDADRAEAHLNLGALHVERGEFAQAEREYRTALRLSPRFPAGYVNLGDLYRMLEREGECVQVLRDGLRMAPDSADLAHALGLALVRQQRGAEALPLLRQAAERAPRNARYAYVHGVGLYGAGDAEGGLRVLREAHARHPGDADILGALVAYSAERSAWDDALRYADTLETLRPEDPEIRALVTEVRGRWQQQSR